MVETTFTKLNESNYPEWSYLMKALLIEKDLWEVVSGEETRPSGGDHTKTVRAFVKKQKLACSKIILHVETSQLAHTRFEDPKEIWDNLESIHRSHGFSTRLALREKFLFSKMGEKTVNAWVSEVKTLALHLEQSGVSVIDEDIILAICAGLPPIYEHFRVSIDNLSDDECSLNNIISKLLNEEMRLNQKLTPTASETAYAAVLRFKKKKRPIEEITCFNCNGLGHYKSDCPSLKAQPDVAAVAEAFEAW